MSAGSGGSRESRLRGAFAAFALALTFASAPALTREAGIAPALEIGGERVTPAHLTLADLSKLPRVRVHASAHGEEADWDGVPLTPRSIRRPATHRRSSPTAKTVSRSTTGKGRCD